MKFSVICIFFAVFILSMLISAAICYSIGLHGEPEAKTLAVSQLTHCWESTKGTFAK